MFDTDILKIQQEVQAKEEKKRELQDEKLKIAKEYLESAKKEITAKAYKGEKLESTILFDSYNQDRINECYDTLRKLGWQEGINVRIWKLDSYSNEEYLIMEVKKFTNQDSFNKMVCERYLDNMQLNYLRMEHNYSIRIDNNEKILDLQEEIAIGEDNKELSMLALVNAAYRNGLEGDIPEMFGVDKIEPTIDRVLRYECNVSIKNYMEILHNKSKEKAKEKRKA